MQKILRQNGLSIVLTVLFLLFLVGQAVAGMYEYNDEQQQHGVSTARVSASMDSMKK